MTTVQDKLDALERKEQIQRLLFWAAMIAIAIAFLAYLYAASQQQWRQTKVYGTMQAIRAAESDISVSYTVRALLDNGNSIEIDIPNVSQFSRGKHIVLQESTNVDSGSTMYRYLRAL